MTAAAQTTAAAALTRLSLDRSPAVTYAVGDIHGQFDLYKALEARILRGCPALSGAEIARSLGRCHRSWATKRADD